MKRKILKKGLITRDIKIILNIISKVCKKSWSKVK